jgi:multicomponent Na+:H+ antiporter subunit F
VNGWLWGAALLAVALVPLAFVAALRSPEDGIVALEAAGIDAALALLLLAEGFHRQGFASLALVLAVTSFAGTIAFVRFLGRLE